jgi:hypothetical protein
VRFEISKRTGCARSGPLVEFEGGGLISYLRGMGRLHTLNTSDGFPRKPRQLGVEFEAEATGCVRAADVDLKSWTRILEETNDDAAVLGNAARFFQLSDKEQAAALLKAAQRAAPQDAQWSGRLGYLYAIGILGVDMVNQNGLRLRTAPANRRALSPRMRARSWKPRRTQTWSAPRGVSWVNMD